jgi:hypothetical protein
VCSFTGQAVNNTRSHRSFKNTNCNIIPIPTAYQEVRATELGKCWENVMH